MSTPTHRSAPLDGMRTLAVVAVLLYHARVSWVQGGASVISVFFPLSGYLITRNLLREWDRTESIGLTDFWWRRVRRLLPASAVAIGFTVAVARVRDIPVRTIEMVSALTGWKNWHYLADYSMGDMLNIWWSLAIEEQYYLVYPVLLMLLLRNVRRRRRAPFLTLSLLAVGSLGWMLLLAHADRTTEAFYGTHARLWELLAGCLLALAGRVPRRLRVPSWLAMALVLGTISPLWTHIESWWMAPLRIIIVVFGTIQLIDAIIGRPEGSRNLVVDLLGSAPFRFVGLISYEVYLVHWAVIIALADLEVTRMLLVSIQLAVTIAVAYLLNALVTPLRAPAR
jgi:peptidoglycan/LPS O-acetylase OafA/YrhL